MLDRSELTRIFIERASSSGVLVGDHIAPKEGGWSEGQPGVGEYRAYAVVKAMNVRINPSSMCVGQYDCTATYTVSCFGTTRVQADVTSMLVREAFLKEPFRLDVPNGMRVNLIWCTGIGASDRIDESDPKAWRVVDTYSVECVAKR